jgi:hypothetical protein
MRVRINFTIDVDVEEYREMMQQELTKVQVRESIQEQCIDYITMALGDKGVETRVRARNNVYDPAQKLTVAEHLVTRV